MLSIESDLVVNWCVSNNNTPLRRKGCCFAKKRLETAPFLKKGYYSPAHLWALGCGSLLLTTWSGCGVRCRSLGRSAIHRIRPGCELVRPVLDALCGLELLHFFLFSSVVHFRSAMATRCSSRIRKHCLANGVTEIPMACITLTLANSQPRLKYKIPRSIPSLISAGKLY